MFSLFGRKDKPDARRSRDGMPIRVPDTTVRGPSTATSVAAQREIGRRTAEKIDQIESEMIDAGTPANNTVPMTPRPGISAALGQSVGGAGARPAPARPQGAPPESIVAYPAARAASGAQAAAQALPPLEFSTSVVLGETLAGAGGIQVSEAFLPPELEEAAILFANAQSQAAAATLKSAIARGQLETGAQRAWLMLLDVLQAEDARAEFESTALDYASRFEQSPPAWQERDSDPVLSRAPATVAAIRFAARLDESAARQYEQARRGAANRKLVTLDFSAIAEFDQDGAVMTTDVLRDFEKSGSELVVLGAIRLFEVARAAIEPGRRDPADGGWKLALEALRLLGEQQAFDDLSIDYCVTYEVSPPSWEPMPANVRTAAAPKGGVAKKTDPSTSSIDGNVFSLRAEITGRMSAELASLRAFAADRNDVVVDCRALRRLDFVAAGELLNEVVVLASQGKSVLFAEPSSIVEALLLVMGIQELADVRRRKR